MLSVHQPQRCFSGHEASSSGRGVVARPILRRPQLLRSKFGSQVPSDFSAATIATPARPGSLIKRMATSNQQRSSATQSASNNSPSSNDNTFAKEAERFARDAQRRAAAFAEEQKLRERATKAAAAAAARLQEAYETAQANASRTYMKLDSEYELTERASRAQRRAAEAAVDLDQTYSVRRRLRSTLEHVKRSWPTWQRRLNDLGQTWYGKAIILAALAAILSTPLFWQFLNIGLVLWWLALPLSLLAIEQSRRKAAEEMATKQAEAARSGADSPFADILRSYGGGATWKQGAGRAGARRSSSAMPKARVQQDGPVIDAEWVSLDGDA